MPCRTDKSVTLLNSSKHNPRTKLDPVIPPNLTRGQPGHGLGANFVIREKSSLPKTVSRAARLQGKQSPEKKPVVFVHHRPFVDKFHANDIPNYKLKLIPSNQVKIGKYHVPVLKEDMAENRFDKVLYQIRQKRLHEDWRQGKFRIIPQLREATPPRPKKNRGSSKKRKRSSSSKKKAALGLDSADAAPH